MPRINKRELSRLNLEMSKETRKQLEDLRDKINADSLSETIRRAIMLYDFIVNQEKSGAVIIMKKNKTETRLIRI